MFLIHVLFVETKQNVILTRYKLRHILLKWNVVTGAMASMFSIVVQCTIKIVAKLVNFEQQNGINCLYIPDLHRGRSQHFSTHCFTEIPTKCLYSLTT